MKGIAKFLGIIVALSLVIRACGGKHFQEWEAEQEIKAKENARIAQESSSSEPPVKRSVWGPTQLAYKKRIDLCDNPDKYANTEMKMEVKYRGGGLRQGGKLRDIRCTVFYGDGSFEMAFTIPSDVSQPRIEPGQYLWLTFVFSGSVDSPSRVTAISRK